jgi:hypothetical protein
MGGNFGFRGPIGSSGLEFFDSFLGQCQKEWYSEAIIG